MADKADAPNTGPSEKTFRSFNREQGANYAQHRRDYHPRLYQILFDYHQSTGGRLDLLLDVGCGPGTVVRTLAPRFARAVAVDPSEGMLEVARSLGGTSGSQEPIRFEVSTIEEVSTRLDPPIADGSVDMIIAATAAHWFDMNVFWPQAARLLRPGGTVALWCSGHMMVDPTIPNGAALQAALDKFEVALDDYMVPGNRMARSLYADLPLPWTLETPVPGFDKTSFVRKVWDNKPGAEPIDQFYAGPAQAAPVSMLTAVLATTSPYVRWQEANPEEVGTDSDPLRVMRNEMDALVEGLGSDGKPGLISGGVAGVLLMVKRS